MLIVSHLLLNIELTRRGAAQSVVRAQAAACRIWLEMEILGLPFQTSQTISSGGGESGTQWAPQGIQIQTHIWGPLV